MDVACQLRQFADPYLNRQIEDIVALLNQARAQLASLQAGALTTSDFGSSLTETGGYQALPSGLKIQWGDVTNDQDAAQTFDFPNTSLFTSWSRVWVNRVKPGAGSPVYVSSSTTTGFTVDRTDGINGSETLNFFAVGV